MLHEPHLGAGLGEPDRDLFSEVQHKGHPERCVVIDNPRDRWNTLVRAYALTA